MVAGDTHGAISLNGLIVSVQCRDIYLNFVLGAVNIMFGVQVDGVALPCHPDFFAGDDFPPGGVGHPCFDQVFQVLIVSCRIERERGHALGIGFEDFALNLLTFAAVIRPARREILVNR